MVENYDIVAGFNSIATGYDLANDAMTLGMHRLWRRQLINKAISLCPRQGQILDIATGTGDVAFGIAQKRKDIKITALDPAEEMLTIAKLKSKEVLNKDNIDFIVGDARQLQFDDNQFDVITTAWGIRNVVPFTDGLKEALRVLRPGGHLLILESGKAEYDLVAALYKYYAKVVPYIGGIISGNKQAYQYYIKSSDDFLSGKFFTKTLNELGFVENSYRTLGFGLIFLYQAQKP